METITKTNTSFSAIQYGIGVLDKKSYQDYRKYAYSKNGKIRFTDGASLLVVDYDIPEGFYDVIKSGGSILFIPATTTYDNYPNTESIENMDFDFSFDFSHEDYNQAVNRLFKEFIGYLDIERTLKAIKSRAFDRIFYSNDENKPVKFTGTGTEYYLMPMTK